MLVTRSSFLMSTRNTGWNDSQHACVFDGSASEEPPRNHSPVSVEVRNELLKLLMQIRAAVSLSEIPGESCRSRAWLSKADSRWSCYFNAPLNGRSTREKWKTKWTDLPTAGNAKIRWQARYTGTFDIVETQTRFISLASISFRVMPRYQLPFWSELGTQVCMSCS